MDAANLSYVNMHLFGTTAFLLWLYFARNNAFYFVRNMFMVAMGIALIGYVVFPTAPPRFMPEWGFTDTVTNMVGSEPADTANVLYNPYAAIPSMHVAFALMIGFSGAKLVKNRVLSGLFHVYPLWVTFVTIATANHFWIDAALGAVAAARRVLPGRGRGADPPRGVGLAHARSGPRRTFDRGAPAHGGHDRRRRQPRQRRPPRRVLLLGEEARARA